ncbi:hypothetical protein QLQ12_22260 [Actinoplanes sp. NEAU-A12]|uniref:Uncharacterized protein n=1 Tax=Actinoplanes sandaracinus TaxID=3045177 RepID=A0ABT6WNN8_9ACTN|nr:hypothetical protein [Actinoplanes sandaracinus]MDI6101344.1 hypothetical protein [Actinoplanes sandaracinus]
MTCRLLLIAYAGLAGILPAAGRPWLAVPLCLAALLATGGLWIRALPGVPTETGVPAIRAGLAAAAGLMTLPLVALLLHAADRPVRPGPLVIGCAAVVTVLGAGALLRERLAGRRTACSLGLPAQRRHAAGPAAASGSSPAAGSGTASETFPDAGSSTAPGSSALPAEDPATDSGDPPSPAGDLRPHPQRGYARTTAAVAIPVVLAVGVGAGAVRGYLTAPHPAEPGYLSVALNDWAAGIDSPVTVPPRGLVVPVRVTSAGLGESTGLLRLRVGGQVVASRRMTVAADSVRSLTVYVPALPADGCLRAIDISVGSTSTGFYARGLPGEGADLRGGGTGTSAPAGKQTAC